MEGVVREFQIEERRLGLLELRGRRQHIVGQSSSLGHGHIDDDEQLQLAQSAAHHAGVGHGVRRIAALDDHGAKPVGVVGQDLLGDDVAG